MLHYTSPDIPGTAIIAADTVSGIKEAKSMLIDRLIEMEDKNLDILNHSNRKTLN
ncbi:hypothetical protein P7H22_00060 [Paenibacillus larvae]|nr:hypothetical protein [Paenibacillus larvae]MDT2239108.1 hypothetical protein [Paenibacillus larvae]